MLFKEKRTDFVCLLETNGVFMGKRLFLSAFLFFSLFSIHAVSLTFQIIQHCSSLKDVCESSLRMEDEIMNAFFEAGYIVSNIPAVPSESEADDDKIFKAGINEAAESSFDNFLALHIYFDKQYDEFTLKYKGFCLWIYTYKEDGVIFLKTKSQN